MKKRIFIALTVLASVMVENHAQSLTKAYKADSEANPILPFNLCADPTAVEYNGRIYVYGTNDQQELNTTKNTTKNTYGKITQLVCMSSADMVNWTFHGTIDVKGASSWIYTSWAPSIVSRVEEDGKTHFYMYYTNTASGIGVLTSTSPTGPWRDPLKHALIDGNTKGRGEQSNIIDPGVCIDDEGNGWLTFGGGDPNKNGTKLMPGNARIVKLGKNMISLDGPIVEIPAPFHFEANELNYINGKFVFSYSGGWSCNSNDWNTYTGKGTYSCPGNCSILSMTTNDPINGTWKYTGEILKNPGTFGYPWGNNHSHLQKFGESYYMFYHTQQMESKLDISGGYRTICVAKASVSATGKIYATNMTNSGPRIRQDAQPVAIKGTEIEAETMANCAGITVSKVNNYTIAVSDIQAGDWTMIRSVSFPEGAKSLKIRTKGSGTLEVRTSLTSQTPLATIDFSSSAFNEDSVYLQEIIEPGKTISNLYFVFTKASGTIQFDRYTFSQYALGEDEFTNSVRAVAGPESDNGSDTYDLSGRKTKQTDRKIYIRKRKKYM